MWIKPILLCHVSNILVRTRCLHIKHIGTLSFHLKKSISLRVHYIWVHCLCLDECLFTCLSTIWLQLRLIRWMMASCLLAMSNLKSYVPVWKLGAIIIPANKSPVVHSVVSIVRFRGCWTILNQFVVGLMPQLSDSNPVLTQSKRDPHSKV